jgi:alpha-N-arabinofuranosidase
MKRTTVRLHTGFRIGQVDPRIFGGFLEHLGRAVYGGVYDPSSEHADEEGCRADVLRALRRLRMTAMRYPGGNFASGYHWLDGVGPAEARPTVHDLAWQSVEPNRFGTDEFIRLCRRMDWQPMLTVNLGTGSPEEARNWVEYCNSPAGTRCADMRAANGTPVPHAVKLWCLGNEMDGEWQLGHVPAEHYAVRAGQAAKMMKDVDRSIELVACGSSGTDMASYMEWDRIVLEYLGENADHLSIHRYVGNRAGDTAEYLGVTNSIDRQIEQADAVCRYAQARRHSRRRAHVCFDEWNVWYRNMRMDGENTFAPHLVEEVYNLEDALVVAGFLNSFIRHADVVRIANLAQIANVIAPVLTDGDRILVQSIFYPFEMMSRRRDGVSLRAVVDGPGYESAGHGTVRTLDVSAVLGAHRLHLFMTNRSIDEPMEVEVRLADASIGSLVEGELLSGPEPEAANSFDEPERVRAVEFGEATTGPLGTATVLPPLSFAAMTFAVQ